MKLLGYGCSTIYTLYQEYIVIVQTERHYIQVFQEMWETISKVDSATVGYIVLSKMSGTQNLSKIRIISTSKIKGLC